MNTKTQEQVDADMALYEAIERSMRAYLPDHASDYTLTDYVTLTAVQKIDSDGLIVTRYPMYVRDGDIPWYKIHGLIDVHKLQINNDTTDQSNNG